MSCNSVNKFTHTKGDTLSRQITITYSDGTAFNLTGYTAFFTIKNIDDETTNDDNAILKIDWTVHNDPTNGKTLLTATNSQMNFEANIYKYDIQIKSSAGAITTVIQGDFELVDDTTKRTTV